MTDEQDRPYSQWTQEERDFDQGLRAFPLGQWFDAQRGKGGYPQHARCSFRRPERVAAWQRGYKRAQEQACDPG